MDGRTIRTYSRPGSALCTGEMDAVHRNRKLACRVDAVRDNMSADTTEPTRRRCPMIYTTTNVTGVMGAPWIPLVDHAIGA
jgi:hypothetical protein